VTISRRTFLRCVAAVPLIAGLDGRAAAAGRKPRVAVIGAGAFGGWTALHLLRGGADVVLLDAWGPGNPRSSSGGRTRVIRAIYGPDRVYVAMVKRAFELWGQLGPSGGEPIYVETGALWMHRGDDSYVRSSLPILREFGFPVDKLTLPEAARRYPQVDFGGVKSVWYERKAGALSAARACALVRDEVVRLGGRYQAAAAKPGPIVRGAMSRLGLGDGSNIDADSYVFACGPWLGQLFPEVIGDRVRPTRQEVYYFQTPAGSNRYRPPDLPIWIDFGKRIVYGIPALHDRPFKLADDTRGGPIDPTTALRKPSEEGIERARRFLAERFPELAQAPLAAAEVCQYENSPDGNLILDRHPEARNVWIVGGGSGHGFKLSPAVGEMAAAAILTGKSTPDMFHLARLRGTAKPRTQFEAREKS
jgi:sarcosine oxidase